MTDVSTTTHSAQEELDRKEMVEFARNDPRVREGELEIDDNAVVSWSADNGAYVQAWLWIGFKGTPYDQSVDSEKSSG
jgi:hypothetical protein